MTEQFTRAAGLVDRVGGRLHIVPPPGMGRRAWAVLVQRLQLFAAGVQVPDGSVEVPVEEAAQARGVLADAWPGGLWTWDWHRAAEEAANRSRDLAAVVTELTTAESRPTLDAALLAEELVMGGFARALLPPQEEAVGRLLVTGDGGNFSVPGSGKTTMTYASYAALRARGAVDRMLVVAPQSAYEAWAVEAAACFDPARTPSVELAPRMPRRTSEVVVVNYERLAMPATRAVIDGWSRGRRLMVVFDEAHRAKRGASGVLGAGARDVAQLAVARFALTGTPMPNRRSDLAAILDLVWPGQGDRLADPRTPNADRAWVRITKDDLGLDEANIEVEYLDLDAGHERIYRAAASEIARDPVLLEQFPHLVTRATTRLLAAACNPSLLAADSDKSLAWDKSPAAHEAPLSELLKDVRAWTRPIKLLRVAQYAHEHRAAGKKLLVWTNFLGNVRELERILAPLNPAVVTGETPRNDEQAVTDRTRELERFRIDPNCWVLIATPQTLGEGVSLHRSCQSQIHMDRSFNAGLFLQAIDRTHRVGMPEGTKARVKVLVARRTVDETVHAALTQKVADMNDLLRDDTLRRLALPDSESEKSTSFDVGGNVRRLLAHLSNEIGEI